MNAGDDLSAEALADVLPGRPLRAYPALLSTEADAQAWARSAAPAGAVVVADYQASPRGRAGLPWETHPGEGLCFSLVLRPDLPPEREGWLYTVAASALADTLGSGVTVEWPDEVHTPVGRDRQRAGAVGVQVELGPSRLEWGVVSVLVESARPPRGALLAAIVAAVERRAASAAADVLADYLPRCTTIGRQVRARLIPMGPSGPQVAGRAVDCLADGALVVETPRGSRVAVRPQNLGMLEDAEDAEAAGQDGEAGGA